MRTLQIPDDLDLLACPVQGKIALAAIRQHPFIGNQALAKLLGLSDSGVRTLLRRLKKEEWIRETKRKGYRHLELLVGAQPTQLVELEVSRQEVTQNAVAEIRQKLTGDPPPGLTKLELILWTHERLTKRLKELDEVGHRHNTYRMTGYLATEWAKMVEVVKADTTLPAEIRNDILFKAEVRRNWYTAVNFAYTHAPKERKSQMLHMAEHARPEQLSKFYERLSANQIGSGRDSLLLTLTSKPDR